MKRTLTMRSVVLSLWAFLSISSIAQEKPFRPKIKVPVLCGIVTDLAGKPLKKAQIAAMWADFGTKTDADELGRWTFGSNAGAHWMKVESEGFETYIFDYVDQRRPRDGGADKPAFIRSPDSKSCARPIYVRLAPTGSNAGFATLDPNKRLSKEKTQ